MLESPPRTRASRWPSATRATFFCRFARVGRARGSSSRCVTKAACWWMAASRWRSPRCWPGSLARRTHLGLPAGASGSAAEHKCPAVWHLHYLTRRSPLNRHLSRNQSNPRSAPPSNRIRSIPSPTPPAGGRAHCSEVNCTYERGA